mgnify:CR=1 FL=1
MERGEVSFVGDLGSDNPIPTCRTADSVEKEITYSTTKNAATVKIQVRVDDGYGLGPSYIEARIEPTIYIEHKHRYKKYGVPIPT